MTYPVLVGIHGRARAGKTMLAAAIMKGLKAAGRNPVGIDFADPIRAAVYAIFDVAGVERPMSWVHGLQKEDVHPLFGVSARRMMQTLGTEWGRHLFGEDFWTRIARERIEKAFDAGRSVVVADVRFPDEATTIRSLGGTLVGVVRPSLDREDDHSSEQGLPEEVLDVILVNDGELRHHCAAGVRLGQLVSRGHRWEPTPHIIRASEVRLSPEEIALATAK